MSRVIVPLLLLLLLPPLWADSSEPRPAVLGEEQKSTEDQEIERLKALVKEMEERIQALERGQKETQAEQVVTVDQARVEKLEKSQQDTNQRLLAVEREAGLDRIRFTGDYRFEAHSVDATIPAHFDGMRLQNMMVDTLFFFQNQGTFPQQMEDVSQFIGQNYGDYLFFTGNLSFDNLRSAVGQFQPAQQQQLFSFLMPSAYVGARDADNSILYTNRLRLQMEAKVAENVSFTGRLGMYKVWGDSTGVQVFNGQPNTVSFDGSTVGVPNSDILRVERAYMTWSKIGGAPMYLSIGRRPSTDGAPLHYRQDELRGGTPAGSLINYQFDGITFGYHFGDRSTFRLCYGLGYESGFGSGDTLRLPQDRLDDAHFFGINWDLWKGDNMFLQATVARAFNVTDGFNGLVVLPNNPVTGQSIPAPMVLRYTPSAVLGDINLASVVFTRRDGPLDWFLSANIMSSDPNTTTTPFGGLFSDPFEVPESRTGSMFYGGARWVGGQERTKIGFEFNRGSRYWFNFALAEDDIIAPKTSTRGNVYEAYLTHRLRKRFIFKLDFMRYDYDYSGSGWHLGTPKRLDLQPLLGFPTYDAVNKASVAMIIRF